MIKILELIDGGFLGGGQIHTLSLACGLDKIKFQVEIAAKGGGAFEDAVNNSGMAFKDIYLPKVLRQKYLKPLIEHCRENKFDIIHTHGGVAGFYGRLLKKHIPEIKTIHSIHGIHYTNSKNFVKKFISLSIEQYLLKYSDKIICETNTDYNTALEIKIATEGKTVIIPNGIDINSFSEIVKKDSEVLKNLGLKETDFVVGNISRFDVQKNQDLIIKSIPELLNRYPNMKFVFVGNGNLLEKVKYLSVYLDVSRSVIFAGEKSNLKDYYSVFDIFVFPTFWEGMPYVLLEAAASSLPVVCSDIPCLREILTDDSAARFINPRSETELIAAITDLYENPELRKTLAKNAFNSVRGYTIENTVSKIEQEYFSVLGIVG